MTPAWLSKAVINTPMTTTKETTTRETTTRDTPCKLVSGHKPGAGSLDHPRLCIKLAEGRRPRWHPLVELQRRAGSAILSDESGKSTGLHVD